MQFVEFLGEWILCFYMWGFLFTFLLLCSIWNEDLRDRLNLEIH